MLQHCFPPNIRQFLDELPETLDETYERMLRGINQAQRSHAHRLLQCLAIAVRPLRVEELAELFAFDFQASNKPGIPKLKANWRWDNQEEALLSTCSSLITIVPNNGSRVVQFSHFSVKEYLMSPRLIRSHGDVSWFHIRPQPAHIILAQACLGTLLQLHEHVGNNGAEVFPLVKYAARYWVDHAQVEGVSACVRDGINDLFDTSKPYFAAWLHVHNIDEVWESFLTTKPRRHGAGGSPLYYAAFCGVYDLAERLIVKHPEQVNVVGGCLTTPLIAALYRKRLLVADLLHKHGAVMDFRIWSGFTPLHSASMGQRVDIARWLLNHGADANVRDDYHRTPLHLAGRNRCPEITQMLLEHDADVNARDDEGKTPLCFTFFLAPNGNGLDVVRQLLEHGADVNAPDYDHSTPLHEASSRGWLEAVRLLLSYGANVDEKDNDGRTPLQVALSVGDHEMAKLLSGHGTKP